MPPARHPLPYPLDPPLSADRLLPPRHIRLADSGGRHLPRPASGPAGSGRRYPRPTGTPAHPRGHRGHAATAAPIHQRRLRPGRLCPAICRSIPPRSDRGAGGRIPPTAPRQRVLERHNPIPDTARRLHRLADTASAAGRTAGTDGKDRARVTAAPRRDALRHPPSPHFRQQKFLDYARTLSPRIYTVDGPVSNIDLGPAASDTGQNDLRRAWLKTFVDQQLIMGADRVVRLRTGQMYPTGFPRFAAETGGCPFRDIVF